MSNTKIVQVINTMISNKEKISQVIREDNEFYFLYDNKFKWSILFSGDEYYIKFYPKDDIQIYDIPSQTSWGGYKDFVLYSTEELKTREARETFAELYQVTADQLYGIDDIFDSIIGDDLF
ncbi:MAG: hypothetical protein IR153_07565 [Flavobacterium sp.]|nr:hypothetical protein [Flavobacterium sp.]